MATKRKLEDNCETTKVLKKNDEDKYQTKDMKGYIGHITIMLAYGELKHKVFVLPTYQLKEEFLDYIKLANGEHFGESSRGYYNKRHEMLSMIENCETKLLKLKEQIETIPNRELKEDVGLETKKLKRARRKEKKYFNKLVAITYVSIASGQGVPGDEEGTLGPDKADIFRRELPLKIPLWESLGKVYGIYDTLVVLPLSKLFILYDQSV